MSARKKSVRRKSGSRRMSMKNRPNNNGNTQPKKSKSRRGKSKNGRKGPSRNNNRERVGVGEQNFQQKLDEFLKGKRGEALKSLQQGEFKGFNRQQKTNNHFRQQKDIPPNLDDYMNRFVETGTGKYQPDKFRPHNELLHRYGSNLVTGKHGNATTLVSPTGQKQRSQTKSTNQTEVDCNKNLAYVKSKINDLKCPGNNEAINQIKDILDELS